MAQSERIEPFLIEIDQEALDDRSELSRGGYFAAMEAPDLLVDDIRSFFRHLGRGAAAG